MKGIFVNAKDLVTVNFVFGITKSNKVVVARDANSFDTKEEIVSTEDNWIKIRMPNYKDNVDILSKTMKLIDGQPVQFDPALIRYERFCLLAVDWSLKDENDKKIELTRESIDNLHTEIANKIMEYVEDSIN